MGEGNVGEKRWVMLEHVIRHISMTMVAQSGILPPVSVAHRALISPLTVRDTGGREGQIVYTHKNNT
jgi:hypothetical protein